MAEAEKVVDMVEKVSGPVDLPTAIAAILIALVLGAFLYNKIWPMIRKHFEEKSKRREETEKYKREIEDVARNQEKNEGKVEELTEIVKQLAVSVNDLCGKVDDISGGYKITISVLLDIINCMDGSTSPENCAKEAKEKVNAYFREGKLPPLVD